MSVLNVGMMGGLRGSGRSPLAARGMVKIGGQDRTCTCVNRDERIFVTVLCYLSYLTECLLGSTTKRFMTHHSAVFLDSLSAHPYSTTSRGNVKLPTRSCCSRARPPPPSRSNPPPPLQGQALARAATRLPHFHFAQCPTTTTCSHSWRCCSPSFEGAPQIQACHPYPCHHSFFTPPHRSNPQAAPRTKWC